MKKGNLIRPFLTIVRIIEINPKDGFAYFCRGSAYYFKEEYDKCLSDMNKAQELGYKIIPEFFEELLEALGRQK